jgi:hypothetical protein
MKYQDVELSVLIHNKPIREYQDPREDKLYVEGRQGSSYVLRLRNFSCKRLLAIISVDGVGIIDGEEASYDSKGYILAPFSKIDIPGWRISDSEVAQFVFGEKSKSYGKAVSGHSYNAGVIGVAVFEEKPYTYWTYNGTTTTLWPSTNPTWTTNTSPLTYPPGVRNVSSKGLNNANLGSHDSTDSCFYSCSVASTTHNTNLPYSVNTASSNEAPVANQKLGTEFGEKLQNIVTTVTFDRQDEPSYVLNLHYDSREGLLKRGINLKPSKLQMAFPAQKGYCKPPKNWK